MCRFRREARARERRQHRSRGYIVPDYGGGLLPSRGGWRRSSFALRWRAAGWDECTSRPSALAVSRLITRSKLIVRQQPVTDKTRRRLLAVVPAVVMSTVPAVMSSGVVVIITVRQDPRAGARIACGFLLRILLGVGLVFAIALRCSA
jgi:hypothetical protein